jgi:hypothetical protein
MALVYEWRGQPAARTNPALCAERYYKYWTKNRSVAYPEGAALQTKQRVY